MKKYIIPSTMTDSHRYKTKKGVISLIYPCDITMNTYEIYAISGCPELNNDIERYYTLKEAEQRIYELLT